MNDVVIIGGSFAGLAAAMQLGRARRKVTVLDTGHNRNRYASHAHNILGFDGVPPDEILAKAREQVSQYPSVKLIRGKAESLAGEIDNFVVTTSEGESYRARRIILAYGIVDQFPEIDGFEACWGKTVIHCPFCHGYEVAGQNWGLVYSMPMSLHALDLYRDWTDRLNLFLDGHEIEAEKRAAIMAAGIAIYDGRITGLTHDEGQLRSVGLEDGQSIALDALFAHPRNRPSAQLHEQIGAKTVETFTGVMLAVEGQQTSVPGVFAAGDLTSGMHSVTISTHAGSMAAAGVQQSMLRGF